MWLNEQDNRGLAQERKNEEKHGHPFTYHLQEENHFNSSFIMSWNTRQHLIQYKMRLDLLKASFFLPCAIGRGHHH